MFQYQQFGAAHWFRQAALICSHFQAGRVPLQASRQAHLCLQTRPKKKGKMVYADRQSQKMHLTCHNSADNLRTSRM